MTSASPAETFSPETVAHTPGARLKELNLSLAPGITFRLESLFPKLTGWGWKEDLRQRVKLLKQVEPLLLQSLSRGEEVVYIAKGVQYSLLEAWMMGIWARSINQTVFVLTNIRVLMFRTDGAGRPKNTSWTILYSEIKKFNGRWNGMMSLKLNDGSKLLFSGFKRQDRRRMPTIFRQAYEWYLAKGIALNCSQSLEKLCSHCLTNMPKGEYQCSHCQAEHWTPFEIAWRSFVFPSWGEFVMGHSLMAIIELLGGFFTWSFLVACTGLALKHADVGYLISGLTMFAVGNGLDALLTSHIARKGLHLKKRPAEETT
ncbi:MAG: hypothetical protein KDA76_03850 [Planctomycetaceae bacterium]|nr:hypothetical protein [Planctomycetaceae bacterium]